MEATREGGVRLDVARLDHQLGLRGITRRRLCELSGVAEPTLSRALHGRPIYPGTLRRLTKALLEVPLLLGADLLIAEPEKKTASAITSPAVREVSRVSGTTSAES